MVDVFDAVYRRRNFKVNVKKSKVMVFERSRSEVIKFASLYRVKVEYSNGERMEEVNEFKFCILI